MRVENKNLVCPIVAVGKHERYGYGDDVIILPGASENISEPEVGKKTFMAIAGDPIICHEGPDDRDNGLYHIEKGFPRRILDRSVGVLIRHHEDEPPLEVIEWRKKRNAQPER
jgi:hypothetical protein